jgi:predicted glycoside hydrolase/deacetylase ChbG (UPF0249 family)
MVRLIVNADDFGWDENRTRAIVEAYRRGMVTTATIMANMPWFNQAAEMAKEIGLFPHIGLHLCLTEGMPLTESIRRSRLFCHEDGSFHGEFHRSPFRRLFLPAFERRAVAEEAEAQMSRYIEKGFPMMHLDSHHHSHTDLSIAQIVMPLAHKFGFRTVRLSRNMGGGLTPLKRFYKSFINRRLCQLTAPNAAFFCAFRDLAACWRSLPDGASVEIMSHPLYRDAESGELSMDGALMDFRSPIEEMATFWTTHRNVMRLMNDVSMDKETLS